MDKNTEKPIEKNKKPAIMEAAMALVAQTGMENFSLAKVAKLAGVSERLIYQHFETRDNLLFACFEQVNREIAVMYDKDFPLKPENRTQVAHLAYLLWMSYFQFLVEGGNRTIFYFEYRNSKHIEDIKKGAEVSDMSYFRSFVSFFEAVDEQYHFTEKIDVDVMWTYILDTTSIMARRIIRGELPKSELVYQSIWKMISGGLLGLVQ